MVSELSFHIFEIENKPTIEAEGGVASVADHSSSLANILKNCSNYVTALCDRLLVIQDFKHECIKGNVLRHSIAVLQGKVIGKEIKIVYNGRRWAIVKDVRKPFIVNIVLIRVVFAKLQKVSVPPFN